MNSTLSSRVQIDVLDAIAVAGQAQLSIVFPTAGRVVDAFKKPAQAGSSVPMLKKTSGHVKSFSINSHGISETTTREFSRNNTPKS